MVTTQPEYPYRQFPLIPVSAPDGAAASGQDGICGLLQSGIKPGKTVLVAEAYPGVDQDALAALLSALHPVLTIHSDDLAVPGEELDARIQRELTEDPVFGIMTTYRMEDFFPRERLAAAREESDRVSDGRIVV